MADLNDTFTDTPGTNLTAHVADSGHTWATDPASGTGSYLIQGNRIYYTAPDNVQNALVLSSWVPSSADYILEWDLYPVTTGINQRTGLVVRFDTAVLSWIHAEYDWNAGSPVFRLSEVVAGVAGVSNSSAASLTAGVPVRIRVELNGTSAVMKADGVTVASITTAVAGAGRVGPLCAQSISSTISGVHIDNLAVVGSSAALSGTAVGGITEADIVAGGKTIIITLTNAQWIP